jgi:hypothetical protein
VLALLTVVSFLACGGCDSNATDPEATVTTAAVNERQPDLDQRAETDGVGPHNQLTQSEIDDGWILLFDGETTFGWRHDNDANWKVADGVIAVSEGEKGLLYTTAQFSDYILKVDFRSAADTNSGIFLSTAPDPQDPGTECYELNIAGPDNPFPTGSLVQRKKVEGDHHSDQWQSYEVQVEQGRVAVKLDDTEILTYTAPTPLRRGHIGLQLNQGRVEFRNVKLKPLGLTSIFNGKDLTGWKTYPDMDSEFTVADSGELNVKNGRGQLETEQSYGDFILQLECISHAPGLNSGIFFRCIPGEQMNGYESQIQNEFLDGDPTKPKDCGTGGIFRRQNARRVVAKDQQWFAKTIVATGPHVAVWVNGYQVTDWTDTRAPDPNPRRGLRVEPGTIMIQGHDPTTNLSFRKLFATELPAR